MYAKLGCIDCMLYERQEELACYHFIVISIQLSWNSCAPHKQSRSVQTLSTGVSVLELLDMPMILCILAEQYWLYILHMHMHTNAWHYKPEDEEVHGQPP